MKATKGLLHIILGADEQEIISKNIKALEYWITLKSMHNKISLAILSQGTLHIRAIAGQTAPTGEIIPALRKSVILHPSV